jgi:tetratricopeptide (TPR) repeat protein
MSPRVSGLSFLAFSFFVLIQAAPAQQPINHPDRLSNNLTITVQDNKGQPVPDARVELRDMTGVGSGQVVASGYTNRNGMYEVSSLPDGQLDIVVQKNLSQANERVDLRMGSTMLTVHLEEVVQNGDVGNNASVSIAQFKVPKKARDEFKKAQSAVDDRKIEEAQKHLAKALEIYPDFAEALTMRAIMALEADNVAAAISDLDRAIKADPSYAFGYFAMGSAFNMARRFDDALKVLNRGVALSPQSWQAYFEMSKAQIGKAEYAAAVRSLDRSEQLANGQYPLIHFLKAHALLGLKQYSDAMNELQAFIDQAPKDPKAQSARNTLEQVKAFVAQQ